MTIALEEKLFTFRPMLEQAGHRVVPLYGFSGAVDAIVYDTESMLNFSMQNIATNDSGILVICAHNISSSRLLKILEEKSYGENSILF